MTFRKGFFLGLFLLAAYVLAALLVLVVVTHDTRRDPAEERDPPPIVETSPIALEEPLFHCAERDRRIPPSAPSQALVYGDWDSGGYADLYAEPGGERLGQALIGDRVEVLAESDGWSQARVLGISGPPVWLATAHLTAGSERVRRSWNSSPLLFVVEAPGIEVEGGPFLPFGALLAGVRDPDGLRLLLPDGCEVTFAPGDPRSSRPLALPDALARVRGFRRVPYQSGANTRTAMDASGLIFLAFRVTGTRVPRLLDPLLRAGREVPAESARAGDVVFVSTFDPERPQPVILLDDGETYVAASPATGVSVGLMSQMRNREVVSVRRYVF